jgi:hypothetical protein
MCALEIFLGYECPCLMDLFTPKISCICLNIIYRCSASNGKPAAMSRSTDPLLRQPLPQKFVLIAKQMKIYLEKCFVTLPILPEVCLCFGSFTRDRCDVVHGSYMAPVAQRCRGYRRTPNGASCLYTSHLLKAYISCFESFDASLSVCTCVRMKHTRRLRSIDIGL